MRASTPAVFVLLGLFLSGCSSPLKGYNPKMGLLDVLAQMEPASGNARPEIVAENIRGAVPVSETRAQTFSRGQIEMQWPLRSVKITSPFGKRGREFHEGVDLRAESGTPVYAAHAGQVLYAGERIRGYGRMIVIKHTSGIATVYAHNSKLAVKKGQWVRQGALVAYSGNTGHSSGPHLHFEVREGVSAVNPQKFMKTASR